MCVCVRVRARVRGGGGEGAPTSGWICDWQKGIYLLHFYRFMFVLVP